METCGLAAPEVNTASFAVLDAPLAPNLLESVRTRPDSTQNIPYSEGIKL
jgi:hypothetical protein